MPIARSAAKARPSFPGTGTIFKMGNIDEGLLEHRGGHSPPATSSRRFLHSKNFLRMEIYIDKEERRTFHVDAEIIIRRFERPLAARYFNEYDSSPYG